MGEIERGTRIEVRDASGIPLVRVALSGVGGQLIEGKQLAVILACTEKEWEAAQAAGREPEGNSWPADNVRALD